LMEDYGSQAKFFTPNGILRGSTAIRLRSCAYWA
jgi:hypothetical protein